MLRGTSTFAPSCLPQTRQSLPRQAALLLWLSRCGRRYSTRWRSRLPSQTFLEMAMLFKIQQMHHMILAAMPLLKRRKVQAWQRQMASIMHMQAQA